MNADALLKNWREAKRVSIQTAATAAHVERQTWWRWETGASRVALDKLDRVEAVTGIPRHLLRPDLADIFLPRSKQGERA